MSVETRKASFGLRYLGGILLLCVAGTVIWLWAGGAGTGVETYEQKRAAARIAKREELAKEVQQKLETTAVLDKDKGIAQIPISRAMKVAAADLAAKQVKASSVKVETPYPYGLSAPAASGTAAPATTGTAVPAVSGSSAPAASGTASPASPAGTPAVSPAPAATSQEVKP